jgi:hypothetical protein
MQAPDHTLHLQFDISANAFEIRAEVLLTVLDNRECDCLE